MPRRRVLVWLRQDLRLLDNPALLHGSKNECFPVYIFDNATVTHGGASKWWLHHSLASLQNDLKAKGYTLRVYKGDPLHILQKLVVESSIDEVVWNRCYEPAAISRDSRIMSALEKKQKTAVQSFNGSLLHEPWEVETKAGTPFKVFTPYWKASLQKPPTAALPEIGSNAVETGKGLRTIDEECETIHKLNLLPTKPDWAGGLRETWVPGERRALERADEFVKEALEGYKANRDFVCKPKATSRLSPHLHFGEISPRTLWEKVHQRLGKSHPADGAAHYLSELGWREFSYHLLYHFPHIVKDPFRSDFKGFDWKTDEKALRAWQQGKTGIPMVDAAMRELWHTGYMHNRSRMVVASFLTKNLLLHWRHGAEWFWDTLVDADQANNVAGWQWVAGCGADAAPYFRIFNPVLQGEKFDSDGDYVRRWVPELAHLCNRYVHKPWAAPDSILRISKVELGKTYPCPIVDVAESRKRALARYERMTSCPPPQKKMK